VKGIDVIVNSEITYDWIKGLAFGLAKRGVRYPDYVFCKPYNYYYFCEYEIAVNPEVSYELSEVHRDEWVAYIYLHPDAGEFWIKEVGHYGAMILPRDEIIDKWNEEFDKPNNATGLKVKYPLSRWSGQSLTFGASQQWCVFHDYDYELSVIASNSDSMRWEQLSVREYIHDVKWAIKYWAHWKLKAHNDFNKSLEMNYINKR
jgi:hypothetical protein